MTTNNSTLILSNKATKANLSGAVIAFNGSTNQLVSSNLGTVDFSTLEAGDRITVTGSASNDGTYTVVSALAGSATVSQDLTTEAEGASITVAPAGIWGNAFKADGYYGYTDGLHTVSYILNTFIGSIKMQATLASSPDDDDWFDIVGTDETYLVAETSTKAYNFTGNFVWVRVSIDSFTNGSITSILYNY